MSTPAIPASSFNVRIPGNAQDAFHFAAYAAGIGVSSFSDNDIRSFSDSILKTPRALVLAALEDSIMYARKAGIELPAPLPRKLSLAGLRLYAAGLATKVAHEAAKHGWDAYSDQEIPHGETSNAVSYVAGALEMVKEKNRADASKARMDAVCEAFARLTQDEVKRFRVLINVGLAPRS